VHRGDLGDDQHGTTGGRLRRRRCAGRQRPPGSQVVSIAEHHPRRRHPAAQQRRTVSGARSSTRASRSGQVCECPSATHSRLGELYRRAGGVAGPVRRRGAGQRMSRLAAFTGSHDGRGRHGAGVVHLRLAAPASARAAAPRRRCEHALRSGPSSGSPVKNGRHATALAGVVVPQERTPRLRLAQLGEQLRPAHRLEPARRTHVAAEFFVDGNGQRYTSPTGRSWQTTRPGRTVQPGQRLTIGGQVEERVASQHAVTAATAIRRAGAAVPRRVQLVQRRARRTGLAGDRSCAPNWSDGFELSSWSTFAGHHDVILG